MRSSPLSSNIFQKKPGCGSTLGEATDDVPDGIQANGEGGGSDSCSDDDDRVSKTLKFDVPQKPITPGEGIALLGQSFDGGFNGISDGLKAIVTFLSGGPSHDLEIKSFLSENKKALTQTTETMERVGAHLERAAQVQEMMLKFMQSMLTNNKQ